MSSLAKPVIVASAARPPAAAATRSERHVRAGRAREGNQALQHRLRTVRAQPKLSVNVPGDEYEREADRIADHVMRIAAPASARPPRVQRACAHCSKEMHENRIQRACAECEERLQRKGHHEFSGSRLDTRLEADIASIRGGGEPLPASARAFFEPRFGRDFSGIRVHASGRAAETAREIDALAYTTRNHIVFAAGRYAPDSTAGRHLLAHELAHTIQQGEGRDVAADTVQRRGDPARIPAGLRCPPAVDSPPPTIQELVFANASTALTGAQKASIQAFIVSWRASGGTTAIRVDGYASAAGSEELNWLLSCERAKAVEAELLSPSAPGIAGIPAAFIEVRAQGETSEFSNPAGADRDGPNRRATISSPPPSPPPAPPRPAPCPAIPTATPAACATRNAGYCASAACFPANAWLPCVCVASAEVCRAAEAFSFRGTEGALLDACVTATGGARATVVAKAAWFLAANHCIWGHWRAAFDAIHDPTRPVPGGLTPEWATAVATCRRTGIGHRDCCRAHVTAEQNAIDRCGPYNSARFGLLPTDVPGSPTTCSSIVAGMAPGLPFTGNFGSVTDRIAYGFARCCP